MGAVFSLADKADNLWLYPVLFHCIDNCGQPLRALGELVDGLPATSKDDERYHGFGLKSIRMIVDRLGGNMVITPTEGRFSLSILLPIVMPDGQVAH